MTPRVPLRLLVALAMLAPSSARGQAPRLAPAQVARIDSAFARFSRPGQPGCALGIVREGELVFSRGYGLASVELGVPIASGTVFDIGSVSKQFTALSVVLLEQDGKLSLDDEIQKYLPEIPRYERPVTIRHLLQHTSGLRDYIDILELSGIGEEAVTGDREALAALARQRGANFPAGAEFSYSNTGFFLASVIVERVSGKSLRDFAAERIFAPLGMIHTRFVTSHTAVVPGKASSYAEDMRTGLQAAPANWEQIGDGGVNTTVDDLARWTGNFTSGRVGGSAAIRELETAGILSDGKPITYALGLDVGTWRGVRRVSHGGAWAGFRAQVTRFPDQGTAIICLCNVAGAQPSVRVDEVAGILLAGRLTAAAPAPPVAASRRIAAPARPLADYTGRYHSDELFAEWEVVQAGDALRLRIGDFVEQPIQSFSDGSFEAEVPIRFVERDGRVTGLTVTTRGVRNFLLTRVESPR